jgi:hypothetical protein
MAKFRGKVGFVSTAETAPGVHSESFVEKIYQGEMVRNSRRWDKTENQNENIVLASSVSFVGDAFSFANHTTIRYVEYEGVKWRVGSIEIQRPRLILYLGDVYNV